MFAYLNIIDQHELDKLVIRNNTVAFARISYPYHFVPPFRTLTKAISHHKTSYLYHFVTSFRILTKTISHHKISYLYYFVHHDQERLICIYAISYLMNDFYVMPFRVIWKITCIWEL